MRAVGRATGHQYVGVGYGRQLRLEGLESRQMLAADLYVNDSWIVTNDADASMDLSAGDTVMSDIGSGDAAISGLIFGSDAFSTIQDGLGVALDGQEIGVLTGAYFGSLTVSQNVSIVGAGDADVSLDAGAAFTGITISSGFDVSLSGITLSNFSSTGIRTQGDLTLSDSTVDGGFVGVWVDGGTLDMVSSIVQNAMIFGVQVGGSTTIASSEISAVATSAASVIVSAGHAEITGSKLFGGQRGLLVNAVGTAEISDSDLSGNSLRAVENATSTAVDASGNWWGSNIEGDVLAETLGLVDVTPYLDAGTDGNGATRGFAGDFSHVHVTTLGQQTGSSGRIQEGIDAAQSLGTVTVEDGTYDEVASINQSLTVVAASPLGAIMAPTTGAQQSVLTVAATNVTIDGLQLQVNQGDDGGIGGTAPIAPVGISATPLTTVNFDGLKIQNVKITSIGNSPANWTGSPGLTVRAAGIVLYASGVPGVEITNNDINVTSGSSFFQRAVWLAQLNADVTGNTIAGAANDLLFQFASGGASLIDDNDFVGQHRAGGAGVNISGPNANAPITISNNNFAPIAGDPANIQTGIVINQNWNGNNGSPVNVVGNTFTGEVLGILSGNSDGLTIDSNTFTPAAGLANTPAVGGDFLHIAIDSDAPSSGDNLPLATQADIKNNIFNAAAGSEGTAISVANNLVGGSYDEVTIGVGGDNTYDANLVTGVRVVGGIATVSDSISGVDTAVQISGGAVTLAGSSLANNTTGVSVSGTGSLTVGTGNSITGGTTGLLLDGAGVSVAGNDLNDLSLSGQSGDYITLANTAFDDDELDGSDLTLGGTLVSAMTPAQLVAAGAKITDELDDNTLGLVDLGGIIVVTPTSLASALDNDYLRIKNAIEAAEDGDTIILAPNGLDAEFNWDEPFALASWEVGNDGTGSTDDDWGILLPDALNNITVTADLADGMTIQGPGDVATANLEGVFIAFENGTNTGWTFENFGVLDFDNAIGFYYAGDDFSDLTVQYMHIRVSADDSADANQNIGIYYSAGQNISITNNLIEFVGTGDGDSLGIQSTTHGGANYDGLNISNNQFVVLGAGTEEITGVWENGHTHLSDITVSGNTFTGLAGRAGEQVGFLVTSHSSATTTVTYSNNTISNVDVGIDWLDEYQSSPQVYTGTQAVVVTNNTMTGVGTGIRVGGVDASAAISGNSITGASGVGVDVLAGASVVVSSGTFQNLDIGIRVAGAGGISGADFNAGTDNETDIQLLASAGAVTLGAGNLFGGTDYFIDNASTNDFDLAALGYSAANYEGLDPGTLADAFAIENRLRHEVDAGNVAAGLIRVVNNTLYVTTPGAEVGISDETIQGTIDAATAGDTIHVQAGTYAENLTVNKSVTLLGAQSGMNAETRFGAFLSGPNGPKAGVGESVITAAANNPLGGNPGAEDLIRVLANDITIDGFVIDGNNPLLGLSAVTDGSGVDIHARRGITNIDNTNGFNPLNNLSIENNILQNFASRGISLANNGPVSTGNSIDGNVIRSFGWDPVNGGQGIILFTNAYADITNNVIDVPTNQIGLHLQNFFSNGSMTWSGNEITVGQDAFGIHTNLFYAPAATLDIVNNTVNAASGVTGASDLTWGINVWSVQVGSTVNVTNNTIGNTGGEFGRGINLWNLPTTDTVTVSGGSIGNSTVGINLDNVDPFFGGGANTTVDISNVSIVGGDVGVRIRADQLSAPPFFAPNTVLGSVTANLTSVAVSGATTGIQVTAPTGSAPHSASVNLLSSNSITGGDVGLAVDGAQALIVGDSLADTIFSGQTDYHVALSNGAMDIVEIDGTLASFAGFIGGSGVLADNFAIEDKLRHATDDAGVGHLRFRTGEVFVTTPGYGLSDETIQNAIDAADAGDTVHVAAGMFSGLGNRDLDVNKKLTIDGDVTGTTIIDADGLDGFKINASGASAGDRLIIKDLTVTDATSGSAAAFRIDGIASFVTLDNVAATGNNIGFLADNTSDVDDLDITNSTFTNNVIGLYSEAETSITNNQNLFDDILLQNLIISGNTSKGIYFEKANDLTLDNVDLTHAVADNGLDLNLKYGDFQNVLITGSSFTNTGAGTAAHIKGRNDVYGVGTDLVGLSIQNSDFTSTAPTASGLSIGNAVSGITFSDADFLGIGNGILFYVTTPQMLDLADSDFVVTLGGYVANATPFAVDGTDATFGGVLGNTATPAQAFAITDKILDAIDVSGLGLVRIVAGQLFVTPNSFFPAPPFNTFAPSVQRGVDAATAGDTIWVNDGTYAGNVVVNKNLTLVSANGRASTTIQGISGLGALGTILVTNSTTDFNLGGASGNGFTVVGIDNNMPNIENAALYFQGAHSGADILSNEIVADGDAGLTTEFGLAITNFTIDNNIFSGQTFVGSAPAGDGFSAQFSLANVPRQLVVMSPNANGSNIVFTNNQLTGIAGGISTTDNTGAPAFAHEQGNGLVTIDSTGSVISGNTFNGTTNRFAASLRARGVNNTITDNDFVSATMGALTPDLFVNNTGTVIQGNSFSSSAGFAIQVVGGSSIIGGSAPGEGNTINGYGVGLSISAGSVLVEGNDLTGNAVGVGIGGGIIDLGQIGLGNPFTGLGVSSGGNDFSGYASSSSTTGAIVVATTDGLAGPQGLPIDITAFGNTWTDPSAAGIEAAVWHDADNSNLRFVDYASLANLVVSLTTLPTVTTNQDIDEGGSATVDGEFVNDAQAHTVTIDWGDSSPVTILNLAPGVLTFSAASPVGFTYTDDPIGSTQTINHGITVTVEEDANPGNFLTDGSLSVDVNNVIPTATLYTADGNLNEGETLSLDVGPAFDPGTDVISAYRINWGDGTNEIFSGNLASVVNHTHQYLDGLAVPNKTVTLDIFDEDGTWNTVASLGILVNNIAPTAGNFFSFDATVDEGSTTSVFFVGPFTDPGNPDTPFRFAYDFNGNGIYGEAGELGDGTYVGSVVASTAAVPAAFLADDDDSPRTIRARIIDNDGGFTEYSVNVNILNVAPVVNAGADANAFAGLPFNHTVSFTDPGADANWTVNVDWNGDGDFLDSGEAAFGVATHSFNINHTYGLADIGFTYNVVVQVDDNDGGVDTDIFQVTVLEDTLRVIDFETFASGFDVTFNRALDLTDLNLYDGNDLSIDLADLTVVGDTLGTINGSIAWNSTTNTLTWVKSGGVLGADDYTVTLISDNVAFKDTMGNLLDGDGDFNDSEVNDDYIDTFSVAVSSDRIVSLPDFARGAGQDVNVPTVEMGGLHLPISINQAAGVTSVDVDIVYDPALLNITGATLGSGPLAAGGWSLTQNPVSPGLLKITISGTTALSGSNIQLIRLNADIPNTAPYADSQIIRLLNLEVNESVIPAKADYAVHKAAYVGDTDGNGVYLGSDAALISRVVVNLDSGFDAHDWTDPVIVGDTTGNGALSGQDASLVAQEAALINTPEIPPLPMIGPLVAGTPGIDPELSVPNVFAAPGDEVTVPVTITVLPGEAADPTVLSATFDVFFNNGSLSLTTGDIAQGTFWDAGDNWSLTKNVIGGQARLVFFNSTPSDIGTGDIAYLTFTLDSGLTPGDVVNLNIQPVDPNEGNLTWTDVDGSIAVTYTADFEPDGDVDGDDLVIWQTGYGIVNTAAIQDGDADRDGDVDGRDFLAWQQQAGSTLFPIVDTVMATDGASAGIAAFVVELEQSTDILSSTNVASLTESLQISRSMASPLENGWISSIALGNFNPVSPSGEETRYTLIDSIFAKDQAVGISSTVQFTVVEDTEANLLDTIIDQDDDTELEFDFVEEYDEVFALWS